ncbi:MAG TPA: ATP-grasp domain-containing protein [Halanaerobiales bacterium]|nr:ATP-grasp domain-containing protein [Halanaerobiales bacterium]
MKLLILGGGNAQLSAIKKAKKMGHEVIISDYLKDAPGIELADHHELVSTFDIASNIKVGKKHNIDGIMTIGTDQPVYTAAVVAEYLSIPTLINKETAKAVTNKRVMKRKFTNNNIPTVNYKLLKKDYEVKKMQGINYPAVLKPLDSQGQRGVFKINSNKEIDKYFSNVLKYSRESEILLEEYYDSDEITVSGWVDEGNLHILTITDRITYEQDINIGICTAHMFPSKHLKKYHAEIKEISNDIIKAFNIKNGPIYFQMLVGNDGIKVNEIACRIGGAYEADFMPLITNVDILKMVIHGALGKNINKVPLKNYDLLENNNWLSVQLFFAKKGKIKDIRNIELIKNFSNVIALNLNYQKDDVIPKIENATARAGYFIVKGKNKDILKNKIKQVYDNLKIISEENKNLILRKAGETL